MNKEVFLAKEIINIVKKFCPIHKVESIELEIPEEIGIDQKKLKALFKPIGIRLNIKKGDKIKVVSITERY